MTKRAASVKGRGRRGVGAARYRAAKLRGDPQAALRDVLAHLWVLFENAAGTVYERGILTADGEPRAVLLRCEALADRIHRVTGYLDGEAGHQPIANGAELNDADIAELEAKLLAAMQGDGS